MRKGENTGKARNLNLEHQKFEAPRRRTAESQQKYAFRTRQQPCTEMEVCIREDAPPQWTLEAQKSPPELHLPKLRILSQLENEKLDR